MPVRARSEAGYSRIRCARPSGVILITWSWLPSVAYSAPPSDTSPYGIPPGTSARGSWRLARLGSPRLNSLRLRTGWSAPAVDLRGSTDARLGNVQGAIGSERQAARIDEPAGHNREARGNRGGPGWG